MNPHWHEDSEPEIARNHESTDERDVSSADYTIHRWNDVALERKRVEGVTVNGRMKKALEHRSVYCIADDLVHHHHHHHERRYWMRCPRTM
jgi:hypothetical protein